MKIGCTFKNSPGDMEATVKTEPLSSPLPDDDEVKPVISYPSGKLDAVDKWRARLLFTHDDDDDDDWSKRLERQIAVLRVALPFLAEDQIRGKAWRRCGLHGRLGAMPRSGLSPQVKRKLRKRQSSNLVKQRLKSEPIKMERDNNLGNHLDNFMSPISNSNFLSRSPFGNLNHLDISQESGIEVLSINHKETPRRKRKIGKTREDKSEIDHTGSSNKLKNNNPIIPESLESSDISSQLSPKSLFLKKQYICSSFFTNLNSSVEISEFPSTLPSYSKKTPSTFYNDMENLRENAFSHNSINNSSNQVEDAVLENIYNDNTLKIIDRNLKSQLLQNQMYTSISQKSTLNQQNNFLSQNHVHYSSSIKQDEITIDLQNINNDSTISNTDDITLSGLENQINSNFGHNSCSKINNIVEDRKKDQISIDQKFSTIQQDITVSHNDQLTNILINNEVSDSSSKSCLAYISRKCNVSNKESLIEDNVDKQNFSSLDTDCNATVKNGNKDEQIMLSNSTHKRITSLSKNSCKKMTFNNPNLVKQFFTKAIYTNIATHGSASQTSANNLLSLSSSIESNSQLINNSQDSLTYSSTQDSAVIVPPDALLSSYSCEYDIAYTKKNLKPNKYNNYYTNKIKTTLQHTIDDIIPVEQSLTEFFESPEKSFRKTKIEVFEKVKNILFELDQDESS